MSLAESAGHHQGSVWGEGFSRHLGEVKALREGHLAVQLPGAKAASPTPFQVQAEDARQREQPDALTSENMCLTGFDWVDCSGAPDKLDRTCLDGVFVWHFGQKQQLAPLSSWCLKKEARQSSWTGLQRETLSFFLPFTIRTAGSGKYIGTPQMSQLTQCHIGLESLQKKLHQSIAVLLYVQGQAELVALVGLHRAAVQTLQHCLRADLVELLDFKSLNREKKRRCKRVKKH